MQPKRRTLEIMVENCDKAAWCRPAIERIDIKRTLAFKGSKTDGSSPSGSPLP